MPAEYDNLHSYLKGRSPDGEIRLMCEAGFSGFWLHDALMAEGIDCVATPPNKGSEKKAIVAVARKLAVRMRGIELT